MRTALVALLLSCSAACYTGMSSVVRSHDKWTGDEVVRLEPMTLANANDYGLVQAVMSYQRSGAASRPSVVRVQMGARAGLLGINKASRLLVELDGERVDFGELRQDVASAGWLSGPVVYMSVEVPPEAVERMAAAQKAVLHFTPNDIALRSFHIESIRGLVATWSASTAQAN